ncbi:MAG: alpha/beta fold hydrolase [Microbacterium sp.]|nr:alpha/beta fold hydrolase [Microbacterium sp.]
MPSANNQQRIALLLGGAAVGVLAVGAAVAFSATSTYFARVVLTPPKRKPQDLRIVGVDRDAGVITLAGGVESRLPGNYGLWFDRDSGHARLGEIVRSDAKGVMRRLIAVDHGEPLPGSPARLDSWNYLSPDELGLPYENVQVAGELGALPAWSFPAANPDAGTWVVHLHGWSARRTESLRAVPTFHDAGFHNLIASYRNDGEGPNSEDGRYALGEREWHDAEAAVRWVLDQGAQRVIVVGFSMGGQIALQLSLRSELAPRIDALVLDSPVVDWVATLHFQGELHRLPTPIRESVIALMSQPWGRLLTGQRESVDLRGLNVLEKADALTVPVLILHSDDDGFVPSGPSRQLAALRPDLVTLVSYDTARHVKLWNLDAQRWSASILTWLAQHGLVER